jgi:hypothetical protein
MSFILMTLTACSNDDLGIPAMSCEISNKAESCRAVPLLNSGHLRIMPGRQFKLKGQYNACYHQETVNIHGRYQHVEYGKGLSIELLATEIKGLKSSEFPSTIAVVTLDKSSLKGVIRDVWATIRSPEIDDKSMIEVTCKLD